MATTTHPGAPRCHPATLAACRVALLAGILLLPACGSDGQFCILGYTTRPNYNSNIRTVRVPIFKNLTFRRGLEFELTRAVVREIEAKTPYKVVSGDDADTELSGTILTLTKSVINRTQLNEVREAETVLGVEVVWKDLRTGEILSQPPPPPGAPPPPPPPPGQPPPPPKPVLIQSTASFIPELGESITTAQKRNVDRLAVQIVSMMETPW
jgi:Lipopolysaccharide-assembly